MDRPVRHLIVTRYNVSNYRTPVQHLFRHDDALNPERLALRFRLFEMATFPNVAAQTDQDFDWIILIDPALPKAEREKLESVVSRRPRTHLVEYIEGQALWRTGWLSPWLPAGDGALATTNLDDDDALPLAFVASLKRLTAAELAGRTPGLRLFGYIAPRQWDLTRTAAAPFGTHAPWHRILAGKPYASACGLTAFIPNLRYNLTVLGVAHIEAIRVFDPTIRFEKSFLINMQRLLRACGDAAGDDWRTWSPETHFIGLDGTVTLPVMLNHGSNEQRDRLEEPKPGAGIVIGSETFPDHAFDWDAVRRYFDFVEQNAPRKRA